MVIFRTIAAILTGYLLFATSSMLLVGLVMSSDKTWTLPVGIAGLCLITLASGLLTRLISGEKKRIASSITAGLVVFATGANILFQLGAEPLWYKLGTLLIIPAGILFIGFHMKKT